MQVETPATAGGFGAPPAQPSRYETLLHQIVQLNTDLQKTAALSQALQRERDGLQVNNHKLKDEAKRLHERCDKLQLVLMQETEQRIESDKKHEELISKWKKQLELKAKAFENLQKTFAPPRDLDQLRMQIQDELEEPNRQRIEQLQQEIEKHREIAFGLRRECEIVKTEYEQFAVDQGNEMECLHATYEMKLNELKRKLEVADECVYAAQNSDAVRKLEQQRTAAQVEIKLLHDEIKDVREESRRQRDVAANERTEIESRLAHEMARSANLELDHKAATRQLSRAKDDHEAVRAKWDHAQTKLLELTNENDKLREQVKQKEQLVLHSHQSVTTKLRDERETWERERSELKERVSELSMKLQAAETAMSQISASRRSEGQCNEDNEAAAATAALIKTKDHEIDKYRELAAAMERKLGEKEDQLRTAMTESEDSMQKLRSEHEQLRLSVHTMELEREQSMAKQSATQELISKIKSECVMLRTKLKEVEMDYRTLQAKHRETIQLHEDIESEKQQMETKLKFAETDCGTLREQLEREREDRTASTREWQRKLSTLESESRSQKAVLRDETKRALSKALQELSRAQRKRDAFKVKCLELHEQYKLLVAELQRHDASVVQLKDEHASELQHVLAQLAQVENDKTALLQQRHSARAAH